MKPALTGEIRIQNKVEFETALLCVEKLMEVAEDNELDPLDPLIEMLFNAIQTWEAQDLSLAAWLTFLLS